MLWSACWTQCRQTQGNMIYKENLFIELKNKTKADEVAKLAWIHGNCNHFWHLLRPFLWCNQHSCPAPAACSRWAPSMQDPCQIIKPFFVLDVIHIHAWPSCLNITPFYWIRCPVCRMSGLFCLSYSGNYDRFCSMDFSIEDSPLDLSQTSASLSVTLSSRDQLIVL